MCSMAKHGDRSLLVRMLLAAVLTPLLVVGLLVVVILALPQQILIGVVAALVLGVGVTVRERRRTPAGTVVDRQAAPELFATVERLCLAADLPRPEIVLETQRQPNSWIVQVPGTTPRLHVTQALLDLLDGDELRAVLAHELSHVANHDAAVMTVVGMPGALLLTGARRAGRGGWLPLQVGAMIAGLIGLCSRVGTSALSRSRELVADRGACAITGRPSALASALLKVSGALGRLPSSDLREATALNSFQLVAAEPRRSKWYSNNRLARRLVATHPSLDQRLAALELMERRVQLERPDRRS
jgi:heat shock protein HtpX